MSVLGYGNEVTVEADSMTVSGGFALTSIDFSVTADWLKTRWTASEKKLTPLGRLAVDEDLSLKLQSKLTEVLTEGIRSILGQSRNVHAEAKEELLKFVPSIAITMNQTMQAEVFHDIGQFFQNENQREREIRDITLDLELRDDEVHAMTRGNTDSDVSGTEKKSIGCIRGSWRVQPKERKAESPGDYTEWRSADSQLVIYHAQSGAITTEVKPSG